MSTTLKWAVRRVPDGYQGIIEIDGATFGAKGPSKSHALARATGLADKVLSNPAVQAALPPGAAQALAATKLVSKYVSTGDLTKAAANVLKSKRLRSLAKALF